MLANFIILIIYSLKRFMSFQDRFQARASFIGREGIFGIIEQGGSPIQKVTPIASNQAYKNLPETKFLTDLLSKKPSQYGQSHRKLKPSNSGNIHSKTFMLRETSPQSALAHSGHYQPVQVSERLGQSSYSLKKSPLKTQKPEILTNIQIPRRISKRTKATKLNFEVLANQPEKIATSFDERSDFSSRLKDPISSFTNVAKLALNSERMDSRHLDREGQSKTHLGSSRSPVKLGNSPPQLNKLESSRLTPKYKDCFSFNRCDIKESKYLQNGGLDARSSHLTSRIEDSSSQRILPKILLGGNSSPQYLKEDAISEAKTIGRSLNASPQRQSRYKFTVL